MRNTLVKKAHGALKRGLIGVIQGYRLVLSPLFGQRCRFYPSCSSYAQDAIMSHGILGGVWLTMKRLLRCHPFNSGGIDPVPKQQEKV